MLDELMHNLPVVERDVLGCVIEHLARIAMDEDVKMDPYNLATSFGPSLTWRHDDAIVMANQMGLQGKRNRFLAALIANRLDELREPQIKEVAVVEEESVEEYGFGGDFVGLLEEKMQGIKEGSRLLF